MKELELFNPTLIWNDGSKHVIDAYHLTENFFAHRNIKGKWTITHAGTGFNCEELFQKYRPKTLRQCLTIAKKLEPLYEWSSLRRRRLKVVNSGPLRAAAYKFHAAVESVLK